MVNFTSSQLSQEELLKLNLRAIFDFDMFCEKLKANGVQIGNDQKFITNQLGKKALLSDLEESYKLLENLARQYVQSHGYSYDPIDSVLMISGTAATIKQTKKLMKGFFSNEEAIKILDSNIQFLDSVTQDVELPNPIAQYAGVLDMMEFEAVKLAVELFMNYDSFVMLLEAREKCTSDQDMYAKYRYLKGEVLQSLATLGYRYASKLDLFLYYHEELTFDEVYDAIKDQVVDDLIDSAHRLGYIFDPAKRLFIKEGQEAMISEVVIQVNLNYIGL